jgi:tetratricopeptide (TPR) repeat protein
MTAFGASGFWLPAFSFGFLYAGALLIIIICVHSARTGKLYAEARRAQDLRLQGRAKEAVEVMEAAVRRMPDDPVLLADFGAALYEAGHVNEAERQFRKAYALDARLPEAAYGIGHCLLGASPELAIRFFSEAERLDPTMAPAIEGRGLAHLACGRLSEAAVDLEAACRIRPESARAQMNAGVLATALGDMKTAELKFREAVRLAPEDAQALANLGALLGSLKEHDEATAILRRAVAANPEAVKERVELAYLLRRAGNRDEAIAHLTAAARLAHENPDVHFRLAMLLEEAGRAAEAAAAMKRAVALDPRLAGGMTVNQRELVAALPIFEGLNEEDVRRVLAAGRTRNIADGQVLVAENEPGDTVCSHGLARAAWSARWPSSTGGRARPRSSPTAPRAPSKFPSPRSILSSPRSRFPARFCFGTSRAFFRIGFVTSTKTRATDCIGVFPRRSRSECLRRDRTNVRTSRPARDRKSRLRGMSRLAGRGVVPRRRGGGLPRGCWLPDSIHEIGEVGVKAVSAGGI